MMNSEPQMAHRATLNFLMLPFGGFSPQSICVARFPPFIWGAVE
jgi:hypothetical protein